MTAYFFILYLFICWDFQILLLDLFIFWIIEIIFVSFIFFASIFLNHNVIIIEIIWLLNLFKFLPTFQVKLSYKSIFNIDDYCLETVIYFILLNFLLQLFEIFKLFHHLFQIVFFLNLSKLNVHHLAPNNKNTLMNLEIIIIVQFKALQSISSIKTIASSDTWSFRLDI